MQNNCYPFVNLPLGFPYDALEPFIDRETMQVHHDRHLKTYIDNLNAILKDCPSLQRLTLEQLILKSDSLCGNLKTAVKNNAGGVYNHRFFFDGLKNPSPQPYGALYDSVIRCFKSFDRFKSEFKKAALSVFGSGYAWLVWDGCRLRIITAPNQATPLGVKMFPILNLDVWEHAYYLKHLNLRGEYIDDWFNVINWETAERRFQCALTGEFC